MHRDLYVMEQFCCLGEQESGKAQVPQLKVVSQYTGKPFDDIAHLDKWHLIFSLVRFHLILSYMLIITSLGLVSPYVFGRTHSKKLVVTLKQAEFAYATIVLLINAFFIQLAFAYATRVGAIYNCLKWQNEYRESISTENKKGIRVGIPDTLPQRYKEVSLHLSVLGIEIDP